MRTNQPSNNRRRYTTNAFTLIELLVVIAIIGILAGVVIASLNSARTKGRHAAIKSNLRNAVSQANIYFNENGTYAGLCSDSTIVSIISALGGSSGASCYAQDALGAIDFGIAATFDGSYFISGANGVLSYDRALSTGAVSWSADVSNCSSIGLALAPAAGLKALQLLSPGVLGTGYIWSSTDAIGNSSNAYRVNMSSTGEVNTVAKSSTGSTGAARCFSY